MRTSVTDSSDTATADGDAGPEPEPPSAQGTGSSSAGPRDGGISVHAETMVPIELRSLEARVRRAAEELPCPVRRAAFRLVDDARMSALHLQHMNIAGTTDVLTFPHADEADRGAGAPIDVDIVICVDEARRQAAARDHAVELEILLYAVHGLLHCSGYDDHDVADAAAMHAEEDRILEAIGVGAVYGRAVREEERP